jgi:hypothetical protein
MQNYDSFDGFQIKAFTQKALAEICTKILLEKLSKTWD